VGVRPQVWVVETIPRTGHDPPSDPAKRKREPICDMDSVRPAHDRIGNNQIG